MDQCLKLVINNHGMLQSSTINKIKISIYIYIYIYHCVKSARIRSYSGLHFPAFGQNTGRCKVSLCIQSGCGKIRSRITPSTDPFHAKYDSSISVNFPSIKPVFSMSETILRYTLEPPVM